MEFIYKLRHFFEKYGFGALSRLAEGLGMRAKNVRIFFIYITFATLGVSFALYLTLAFILRLKNLIYTKRTSVFDL